jgi:hypothetical protein
LTRGWCDQVLQTAEVLFTDRPERRAMLVRSVLQALMRAIHLDMLVCITRMASLSL